MELWYPEAARNFTASGAGSFVDVPKRGVLHTTESSVIESALSMYRLSRSYPHFTVDHVRIEQHCPLNVAATALVNKAGGVETNRQGAIQIEVVGYASKLWSQQTKENVRKLMIWLEHEFGIQPFAPQFLAYPSSYGSSPVRMTFSEWAQFNGWCGHQHVPENEHGDPGWIDVPFLLDRPSNAGDDEMQLPDDVVSEDNAYDAEGNYLGTVRLLRDGGVRCYFVPFYGSIFSIKPDGRKNWSPGAGVVKFINRRNPQRGYVVTDWDNNMVAWFTPEQAAEFKKQGTL